MPQTPHCTFLCPIFGQSDSHLVAWNEVHRHAYFETDKPSIKTNIALFPKVQFAWSNKKISQSDSLIDLFGEKSEVSTITLQPCYWIF